MNRGSNAFAESIDSRQPAQSAQSARADLNLYFSQLEQLLPFPKRQILDSCKLKEFADENFKFDANGRMLSKQVENTMGKGQIARYISQCFEKTCCRHVKIRACLRKGFKDKFTL